MNIVINCINYLIDTSFTTYCQLITYLIFIKHIIATYNTLIIQTCSCLVYGLCAIAQYPITIYEAQNNLWFISCLSGIMDNTFLIYYTISTHGLNDCRVILYIIVYYLSSILSDYIIMRLIANNKPKTNIFYNYIINNFKISVFLSRFIPGLKTVIMYFSVKERQRDFIIYSSLGILANILFVILYYLIKKSLN